MGFSITQAWRGGGVAISYFELQIKNINGDKPKFCYYHLKTKWTSHKESKESFNDNIGHVAYYNKGLYQIHTTLQVLRKTLVLNKMAVVRSLRASTLNRCHSSLENILKSAMRHCILLQYILPCFKN